MDTIFTRRISVRPQLLWTSESRTLVRLVAVVLGRGYKQSAYGRKIRYSQFLLDDEITPLNHNGNVPKAVLATQRQFQVGLVLSVSVFYQS